MQIAIGLYPELTVLDVIGPYQVLTLLPDVEVILNAGDYVIVGERAKNGAAA